MLLNAKINMVFYIYYSILDINYKIVMQYIYIYIYIYNI